MGSQRPLVRIASRQRTGEPLLAAPAVVGFAGGPEPSRDSQGRAPRELTTPRRRRERLPLRDSTVQRGANGGLNGRARSAQLHPELGLRNEWLCVASDPQQRQRADERTQQLLAAELATPENAALMGRARTMVHRAGVEVKLSRLRRPLQVEFGKAAVAAHRRRLMALIEQARLEA